MNYLDEWLSSIDDHLSSVTSEELEENYLLVKDGHGQTIKEFLSCDSVPEYNKGFVLSNDETKFVLQERITAKFDKVPTVTSTFLLAENDDMYDVAA